MALEARSYSSEYPLRGEGQPHVVILHSKRFDGVKAEGSDMDIDRAYQKALEALELEVRVHEQAAELRLA